MDIPAWILERSNLLGRRLRAVLVLRGGPENGPYSAMAARILSENLPEAGIDIEAIYASSGSVPTAVLGCTGDYPKLCDIWANLNPEDVVGKISKVKTTYRILREESFLRSRFLRKLLATNADLEKIFSQKSLLIKFPAVDLCTNEYIIFSNKVPGHKKWFWEGVLGSMGLIPFLPPQRVFDPEGAGLIGKGKSKNNGLLLIDGGFMGNMLLEEAMRDDFDVIFLIDIHGLKSTPSDFDAHKRYWWPKSMRSGHHILSSTNDQRQYQMDDRINEEIRIKKELLKLRNRLPPECIEDFQKIIDRMNTGRLSLGDKDVTEIFIVSNQERSTLFNFASFTHGKETLELMTAGLEAAENTLREIGLR